MTGDFNLKWFYYNEDTISKMFCHKVFEQGFILLTNNPPRVCKNSATIIVTFLLAKSLTIFYRHITKPPTTDRPPTTNNQPPIHQQVLYRPTGHRQLTTDPLTGPAPTHRQPTTNHRPTTGLPPTQQPPNTEPPIHRPSDHIIIYYY